MGEHPSTAITGVGWIVLQRIRVILQYEQAVRVLDMCPEGCLPCHRDACTSTIAVLLTVANEWSPIDGRQHLPG